MRLGELDPENATFFRDNARHYALEIRKLRGEFDAKIQGADLSKFRCASMHSGYDYIMQELGLLSNLLGLLVKLNKDIDL